MRHNETRRMRAFSEDCQSGQSDRRTPWRDLDVTVTTAQRPLPSVLLAYRPPLSCCYDPARQLPLRPGAPAAPYFASRHSTI